MGSNSIDLEAQAMFSCVHGLEPLNPAQRKRVMEYLHSRYEFGIVDSLLKLIHELNEENKKLKAKEPSNGN